MKSYCKCMLLACASLLLIVFSLVVVKDRTYATASSNTIVTKDAEIDGATKERDDALFEEAVARGVGAVQIELAMAERKHPPPLQPLLLPDKPHAPLPPMKRILIVSTWRAGSSFLGEVIHSAAGVFYSYEPLHFFDYNQPGRPSDKLELLKSIFQCQFPRNYLDHVNGRSTGGQQDFMSRNRRVWEACYKDRALCNRPDFVRRLCTHFPVQLAKIVRLRLRHLLDIVNDDEVKIVYLTRDPRGIMASRVNLTWCTENPDCSDVRRLCNNTQDDFESAKMFKLTAPEKFYLLRFEDFTADPETETHKLFAFLGLQVTVPVQVFLHTHTRTSQDSNKTQQHLSDPFSTNRMTKKVASEWRSKLKGDQALEITNACNSVLKSLNYEV